MINYVVGFMFNEEKDKVVLIKKNRPKWQEGKLNGVGGHIENNEHSSDAIIREFKEETGVEILKWNPLISITSEESNFILHFYFCFGNIYNCKSVTDEEIIIVDVNNLPSNIIPNLKWLIPLCLDPYLKEYDNFYFCKPRKVII